MTRRLLSATLGFVLLAGATACSDSGEPTTLPVNPGPVTTATPTPDPTPAATATPTPSATATTAPTTPRTTTPPAVADVTQECAQLEAAIMEAAQQSPTDAGMVIYMHVYGDEEVPPEELAAAGQTAAAFVNSYRNTLLQIANQSDHAGFKQLMQQFAGIYANIATLLSNGDYEGYVSAITSMTSNPPAAFQGLQDLCNF